MTDFYDELKRSTEDAKTEVLAQGGWLAASKLGLDRGYPDEDILLAWRNEGRLFTVDHDGEDYFPTFALDPKNSFNPYPVLQLLLAEFRAERRSDWDLAFWLCSANGYLDGTPCPSEVLAGDQDTLLFAARCELQGILHG